MTSAKPVPFDEVLNCRDSCARELAILLGVEPFESPARAASGLLLGGGLSSKQAELAAFVVWLDRALPAHLHVEEYKRGTGVVCHFRASEHADWYEVETDAVSEQEIQLSAELGVLGSRLSEALRMLGHQWNTIEELLVRFVELGMRASEMTAERVRSGRVVRSHSGRASEAQIQLTRDALRDWKMPLRRWDFAMLKCAAVGAELDVFRESVQLARPSDPASQVFLNISIPGSLDEWRAARRELEKRLFAAGFKDSEIRALLPDGGRDDRGRRVAARRNRGRAGKAGPAAKVSAKSAS